jgi:hypothetical protein
MNNEEFTKQLSDLLSKVLPKDSILIIPAVFLLYFLFSKFKEEKFLPSFFSEKVNLENLEDLEKLNYDDEGKKNYRNAFIFSKITGKVASIETINWIFNCFDPRLAIYIYSKVPAYLKLKDGKLIRKSLTIDYFFIFFLAAITIPVLILCCLYGISIILGATPIKTNSTLIKVDIPVILTLSCLLLSIYFFDFSLRELRFINIVNDFYNTYSLWIFDDSMRDRIYKLMEIFLSNEGWKIVEKDEIKSLFPDLTSIIIAERKLPYEGVTKIERRIIDVEVFPSILTTESFHQIQENYYKNRNVLIGLATEDIHKQDLFFAIPKVVYDNSKAIIQCKQYKKIKLLIYSFENESVVGKWQTKRKDSGGLNPC